MIIRKSKDEIATMRHAGRIVAQALKLIENEIKPGVETLSLDLVAEKFIRKSGARPAFKGYRGFPASVCTSVNEAVVHGIPGHRRLKDGDIVSIDVGVEINGYYADAAATFPVGSVSVEVARLIDTTRSALEAGISKCVEDNYLYDISHEIQVKAESAGYSVVREFVGHGIGREMHEDPQIPNFGSPGRGPRLKAGMVFAIEPMLNMGGYKVEVLSDGWTVVTADKSLSAHFEHTIAITKDGPVVLTAL